MMVCIEVCFLGRNQLNSLLVWCTTGNKHELLIGVMDCKGRMETLVNHLQSIDSWHSWWYLISDRKTVSRTYFQRR